MGDLEVESNGGKPLLDLHKLPFSTIIANVAPEWKLQEGTAKYFVVHYW